MEERVPGQYFDAYEDRLDLWGKGTVKPLLLPGGALFLAAVILLQSGILPLTASATTFYFYAAFCLGGLLAWRFHSSRILLALVSLFLAQRAMEFFSPGRALATTPGHTAFELAALLLPLNFVVFSMLRERGLALPAIAPRLGLIFVESVFVAVLCRPGNSVVPAFLHPVLFGRGFWAWSKLPQLSCIFFIAALGTLFFRFWLYRKPVESGLLWSLAAAFMGLQSGAVGRMGSAYMATGGLILAGSIIENSYVLAYHDELTGLPARRAFNDALLELKDAYSLAILDIDHFKTFNDTHGHDVGDQVLRMVAGKLAQVSGGGRAFRVGGEEFCIVFQGETLKDALPHLELLRHDIENSAFLIRGNEERRRDPQAHSDRRKPTRRKSTRARAAARSASKDLSVTVSLGAAEPTQRARSVEQVIHAADQALYRAKENGRNRVESASPVRKLTRSIA